MENKHYIRLDGNFIIKGFSDAFEQPIEGDILLTDQGGRHFVLDGKTNPSLFDEDGFSLYKYVAGEVVDAYPEEQPQYETVLSTKARAQRDRLLAETDWMVLSDSPAPSQDWLDYRQALRDIPAQGEFPTTITWPTKP